MIGETGLSKLPDLPESSVKVWTISNVWSSGKSKVRRNPDIYIFVNLAVPFFFYLTVYLLVRHFPHSLSTNLKHAKKNPVLVLTLVLGAAVLESPPPKHSNHNIATIRSLCKSLNCSALY